MKEIIWCVVKSTVFAYFSSCLCKSSQNFLKPEYLLDPMGREWYLRQASKSNFDHLWPWPLTYWPQKLMVSSHCPADHLCSKIIPSFLKYRVCKFGNTQMYERTSRKHYSSGQSRLVVQRHTYIFNYTTKQWWFMLFRFYFHLPFVSILRCWNLCNAASYTFFIVCPMLRYARTEYLCVCVCVRHTFCQLTYRSDPSTDFNKILYTAADFELDECHVIKNEKVALDRLRVRQNVFLIK